MDDDRKFEKNFPSLKGKEHIVTRFVIGGKNKEEILSKVGTIEIELARDPNYFEGVSANIVATEKVFDSATMQKFCLDKSKVKQAIQSTWLSVDKAGHAWVSIYVRKLLKELGMEK